MDIQSIVGTLLAAGGALYAAWTYVKGKAPKAADLVEDVLNRLQNQDGGVLSRSEALEHVDVLSRYLEAKGSIAGNEAILVIVKEIFATKA